MPIYMQATLVLFSLFALVAIAKMKIDKDTFENSAKKHREKLDFALAEHRSHSQAWREEKEFLERTVRAKEAELKGMTNRVALLAKTVKSLTSRGETISAIAFTMTNEQQICFATSDRVDFIEMVETPDMVRIIEHLFDGTKQHSIIERSKIQSGIFVKYSE